MDIDTLKQNINILACPECRGILELVEVDQRYLIVCNACALVYPVIDDIAVVLPLSARNLELELGAIKDFSAHSGIAENIREACDKTIWHLESMPEAESWEWEDEKHWSAVYEERMNDSPAESRWNSRRWQRRPIIDPVLETGILSSKSILDIGCGEGQNFRMFFADACTNDCLYIATDISLNALRLNRALNRKHDIPALYILCSADSLPFQKETIDIAFLFGILHHTRFKEKNIASVAALIRYGGWIVIHEAVQRFKKHRKPAKGESAHEERINHTLLKRAVYGLQPEFAIVYESAFFTLFYLLAARLLGPLLDRHWWIYKSIEIVDRSLAALLGWMTPVFRPSEQKFLLYKKSAGS